jgi:hypothetical protein
MHKKAKFAFFCTIVLLTSAVIFGSVFAVSRAAVEKAKYIESEKHLAISDLCAALEDMERALTDSDGDALNRAAGRAEAYLSRAGLRDAGEAYGVILRIAEGEGNADDLRELINAARSALNGEQSAFSVYEQKNTESYSAEATDDKLSAQMLERLGKGRDDVALSRATAFACENAVFDEAECADGGFKYSGDNIFISVGGSGNRVLMYCFERDIDPRYSISAQKAMNTTMKIVKKEKLKLGSDPVTELRDGIYRSIWYKENSDKPLIVLEIYADTGRLRLYNAIEYYKNQT